MERKKVKQRSRGQVRIWSPVKQRVLLLLQAGVALSYAGTLGRQMRILGELGREWKDVERNYLRQIVREFHWGRLVSEQEHDDGTKTIVLTERGEKHALRFNVERMSLKTPPVWGGVWHVVMFDIPEKYKGARLALRDKLLDLGFFQCQKSVYIYPHPCQNEVDFVVEFFKVRRFVRYGVLAHITNEAELLLHFNLKKPAASK